MGVPRMIFYSVSLIFAVVGLILNAANLCHGGITSSFLRVDQKAVDMPLDTDVFQVPPGYNAPQQVHITQGDLEGKAVIVYWVTVDERGSNTVLYWSDNATGKLKAKGTVTKYKCFNYASSYIHHATIKHLKHDTKYHYEVGIDHTSRIFWFVTPSEVSPDVPYTFGLMGTDDVNLDKQVKGMLKAIAWTGAIKHKASLQALIHAVQEEIVAPKTLEEVARKDNCIINFTQVEIRERFAKESTWKIEK